MKKVISCLAVWLLVLCLTVNVWAAEGNVTYSGNAGQFVFEPGSEHSLTDLFPDFKDVMPGDTLTQKITVKNDADDRVKVDIYIRSLGAHPDSKEFLSQLGLKVARSEVNDMPYMFEAAAHETAQLTQWVHLGTLYSGGEVNLDVTLEVPVTLDNAFQDQIGYLDWEFLVEELPAQPDDPKPPQTGDESQLWLWVSLAVLSGAMLIFLILFGKKRKKEE